jgi:hypothetical protein
MQLLDERYVLVDEKIFFKNGGYIKNKSPDIQVIIVS